MFEMLINFFTGSPILDAKHPEHTVVNPLWIMEQSNSLHDTSSVHDTSSMFDNSWMSFHSTDTFCGSSDSFSSSSCGSSWDGM
jgi:hypothetical protein